MPPVSILTTRVNSTAVVEIVDAVAVMFFANQVLILGFGAEPLPQVQVTYLTLRNDLILLVWAGRFERPTPCAQGIGAHAETAS